MEEKEILEIQNLGDDELLEVHQLLVDHIQYLNSNIIDNTVEETVEEGGESADE